MHYKLFVFDLDETLWTVSEGLCSMLKPPFNMTAPDRLETNEGFWIELKPGVHKLFDFLNISCICKKNSDKNCYTQ